MKASPPRAPGRTDQRGFNEMLTGAVSRLTGIPAALNRIEQALTTCLGQTQAAIAGRMNWPVQQWAGGPHEKNDAVRDGFWTMVANKATPDRPAPQAIGDPLYVSDLPGTPSWVTETENASALITGQRYTWPTGGWRKRVRIRIPVAGPAIEQELWIVTDPTGVPVFQRVYGISGPEAGDVGWIEIPIGTIISLPGAILDVFQLTRALDTPTSWSGTWDYKRSNGDPGEKEIYHQSAGGGREMRINHIDEDENDRSTELEALAVGDEIAGGGITWIIQSTEHHLDHVRFEVDPASRASEGKYAFQFTTYAPQPIQYDRVVGHFSAQPEVQGFFSTTGYDNLVLDQNAYGVDLQVQDGIISPDWDLLAYSGD